MVQERTGPGSTVMTDEHAGYRRFKERRYDRRTTCHGEGEYESGKRNYIHVNNYE